MYTFSYLQDKINQAIKEEHFGNDPSELYDPIGYTLALGGKRLRPVLTLMACDLFGGDINNALNPALGVEIFHNFTLLHDDIMDKAPIRRGHPTVHKKWNPDIAILSGDTMFAIACNYFLGIDKNILPDILSVFTKTAIQVCEGQQYDMNFEMQGKVSVDDYLKMIRLKTAVLFAASLKIGAIIGRASAHNAMMLYNYGENLGLAFQLKDDLLDIYGDEEKFGKKKGGDISVNKKTFLYLKAFELAQGQIREQLISCFADNKLEQEIKINRVIEIYDTLNIRNIGENKINEYFEQSMYHLNTLDIENERKVELIKLGELLIKRDY